MSIRTLLEDENLIKDIVRKSKKVRFGQKENCQILPS